MALEIEAQRLLDVMPDAVIVADGESRIAYLNSAAERLLGWPPGDLVGRHLTTIQPERLHQAHNEGFARFVATGEAPLFGMPTRVPALRHDGSEVDIELNLSRLDDGAATDGGLVLGILRDLTERHELERHIELTAMLRSAAFAGARLNSLLDREQVLETIVTTLEVDFGAALARVWLHDEAAGQLLLRASAGVSRKTADSSRAVVDVATHPFKLGEVARTRTAYVTNELRGDPQFDQTWVESEGIRGAACFPLVAAGRLLGIMVHFAREPLREEVVELLASFAAIATAALHDADLLDLERLARTDAEAARSRLSFLSEASLVLSRSLDYEATLAAVARLAVPALADWCLVDLHSDDGRIQLVGAAHVDPAAERLIHKLREAYPPGPEHAIQQVLHSGEPLLHPHIGDEDLRQRAMDERHLRLMRRLGIVSDIVVPLVARGHTLGTISLISASATRTYDESDVRIAEGLARRAAAAIDNAILYREAQQAIAHRDEFLAVASHELRTPITVVQAYTQTMQRSLHRAVETAEPLEPQRLIGTLAKIEHSVGHLTSLIEELLDISRAQTSGLVVDLRDTDLSRLIALTADSVLARQHDGQYRSDLHLEVRLPVEGNVHGLWDPPRLEQVLQNLMGNAMKYSPAGGHIEVRLQLEPGADGGPQAHLSVIDSGIGIESDDMELIFRPFGRGRNASVRQFAGFGMGLTLARDIVERLSGRIWADSEGAGHGSVFHVVLPGARLEPAIVAQPGSVGPVGA